MASDPGVPRRATAGVAVGLWLEAEANPNPCDFTRHCMKGTRSGVCL